MTFVGVGIGDARRPGACTNNTFKRAIVQKVKQMNANVILWISILSIGVQIFVCRYFGRRAMALFTLLPVATNC
jgi:hypothetical protein